jgi:hypothetical protein
MACSAHWLCIIADIHHSMVWPRRPTARRMTNLGQAKRRIEMPMVRVLPSHYDVALHSMLSSPILRYRTVIPAKPSPSQTCAVFCLSLPIFCIRLKPLWGSTERTDQYQSPSFRSEKLALTWSYADLHEFQDIASL